MSSLSLPTVLTFAVSMVLQLAMICLLPMTRGYTSLWPTLVVLVCMNLGFWLFARVLESGTPLSMLIPISATMIPLGAIAVGVIAYDEPMSWTRGGLLLASAGLVGMASRF